MRDPLTRAYRDIEMLDLGNGDDGQWATITADETVRYHSGREAAESAVRRYRESYGRRADDGGPLRWPIRQQAFKGEPWEGD